MADQSFIIWVLSTINNVRPCNSSLLKLLLRRYTIEHVSCSAPSPNPLFPLPCFLSPPLFFLYSMTKHDKSGHLSPASLSAQPPTHPELRQAPCPPPCLLGPHSLAPCLLPYLSTRFLVYLILYSPAAAPAPAPRRPPRSAAPRSGSRSAAHPGRSRPGSRSGSASCC